MIPEEKCIALLKTPASPNNSSGDEAETASSIAKPGGSRKRPQEDPVEDAGARENLHRKRLRGGSVEKSVTVKRSPEKVTSQVEKSPLQEETKKLQSVIEVPETEQPPKPLQVERQRQNNDCVMTRPANFDKMGKSGDQVKLIANYFEVIRKLTSAFRLYRVDFNPPLENSKVTRALLKTKEPELGAYLFDGTMLFTTKKLPNDTIKISGVGFLDSSEKYDVTIAFVRDVEPWEPLVFQLYNIILRKAQQLVGFDLLGRHYFDKEGSVGIAQWKLELWPGFVAVMRQQEENVMLRVDLTFKALRTENVFQQMREIRNNYPEDFQRKCEEEIVGAIVMTRYNRRTYKVNGIEWTKTPMSTFPSRRAKKEGEDEMPLITFKEYFTHKHHAAININNQPMLIAKPKKKDFRRDGENVEILLVPELCFRTGLTQDMRENFQLMKQMAEHLHQSPVERLRRIRGFIQRLTGSDQVCTEMERWGVKLKPEPVKLLGRRLQREPILFKDEQMFLPTDKGDWGFAFKDNKMLECFSLENWVIIYPQRNNQAMDFFITTLMRCGAKMGYRIEQPLKRDVRDVSARGYIQSIEESMIEVRRGKQTDPHLVMVVLANNKGDTYAAIKKACSVGFGVPSQCILTKNVISKRMTSICEKMLIQMNAKQGGTPWTVKNPMKNLMVVGFDMYSGGGTTVGAMVATVSDCMTKFYSTVIKVDSSNLTYGSSLESPMNRCLQSYKMKNGQFPDRIMIYRDGVGEGQLQVVVDTELESVKSVIKSMYGTQELPKLTFIIVTKRVCTRLFGVLGNEIVNPAPGTVADSVITCPERYDFYMIPQSVRQGTVSPVSFHVIKDTSGLQPDHIQRFTFKMCHLYFNWSGTIPVPAVCQYARKLAFLTGTALHGEVHPRLRMRLHYL